MTKAFGYKRIDGGVAVARVLLAVGAVALVLVLGYRQYERFRGPLVSVWVTATPLPARHVLSSADLIQQSIRVPVGALGNPADIVGRPLLVAKAKGEPLFPGDLDKAPATPGVSNTIPEGRVLATLPIRSLDLPTKALVRGDRIDVLQATRAGVRQVAHDAFVMGTLGNRAANKSVPARTIMGVDVSVPGSKPAGGLEPALVLAIRPEDAFALTAAESGGPRMKLLLHGEAEVKKGELLSVVPPAKPAPPRQKRPSGLELLIGSRQQSVNF